MAEQETEEEPSIEEILTSIRQIISDDDEEGEGEEAAASAPEPGPDPDPEPEPTPEPEEAEEAIELTDVVEEAAPEPEPEPEPEEGPPEVEIDLQDIDDDPEEEVSVMAEPVDDLDSVLTDNAENAAYDGFSELVKKTAIEHNGITVEEIDRTELKIGRALGR